MTSNCPNCGASETSSELEIEKFQYGQGNDAVTLTAQVPVYACAACDFRWTGKAAEDARHAAVCAHFGVMSPQELMDSRDRLKYSREQLAEVSGLGVASIARWELGLTVQNKANDNLIYLLSFEDNRNRLLRRKGASAPQSKVKRISDHPRFRGLGGGIESVDQALVASADSFELQKEG